MNKISLFLAILFFSGVQFLNAQGIEITGTVTDGSTGDPLPGVNVIVTGTISGTVTGLDGKFSLEVPDQNAQLTFSFVGYLTETVSVGTSTVIEIALSPDIQSLTEVVVIGYGTQRKEAVTGSVASIGGDEMRDIPASNVTQALQGRIAGVQMSQTSSKPGAEMQIRIRGTRSLTGNNDPLIVLDGIPFSGSIGDINPNDIKSIDILKDASATAIYGSRGANGVILLTTNKGRKGQKAKLNYNSYFGLKKAIKYPMMNGPEFAILRDTANKYTNGPDEFDGTDTDWQDLFYRIGLVTSHDIGVTGGTETGSYNFGVGYYLDQAVIPTQQYSRYSIRASLDQEISDYVKIGLVSNSNFNLTEGTQVGMYGILSMSPLIDPYEEDGSFKRIVSTNLDDTWIYPREVIEDVKDRWLSEQRAYGSYNNLYTEIKAPGIEGLKYRINLGMDLRLRNSGSFTGQGIKNINELTESSASVENQLTTHWVVENLLTYDRTFAQKHNLNIVALYSAEETKFNKSHMSAKNIPVESFQFYNLGAAEGDIVIDPNRQDYKLSGLISYMGRAMYAYDNRYMLSATLRSDGSSRLAPGYKWHTYPAVSVGWNLGNESFMENISTIDNLKIRAGYGQTSNQAVAPYSTLGKLKTVTYNFGPDFYSLGSYIEQTFNPGLGWEYSETMNFGIDFSLLRNRLSGTFEFYNTNTVDILQSLGLPPSSGVRSVTKNVGEMQNRGIELSLNGVIIDNPDGVRWEAGINIYANKNKLTKLASGKQQDLYNGWFVGHPINSIYDYEPVGLWQREDSLLMTQVEPGFTNKIGMIRVRYTGGFNEDGTPERVVNSEDKQVMSVDPDFMGGFNTRVSYKGVDLSVVGTFQRGGLLISTLYSSSGYLNMLSGRRGNVKADYWTPENTDARFPNPQGPVSGDNPKYGSTMGFFDASFLKIRTISLGYTINKDFLQSLGMSKLRVYCTVQNPLVLFSDYHRVSGMDPETNSYGNENSAVTSYQRRILTVGANTPSTKNILFGLNASF